MKHTWYTLTLLVSLSWAACTVDPPEPIDGEENPVFVASINLDSVGFIQAGVNDYYLFTRVERPGGILVMSGAFAKTNCPDGDCPESLKFEFWNNTLENMVELPEEIFGPFFPWQIKGIATNPLGTVAIQWTDTKGRMLRSDWYAGFQDSTYMTITASEPWENNERGEKTWKMDVNFSCWLMDSTQTVEQRIEGTAVIAVGYR